MEMIHSRSREEAAFWNERCSGNGATATRSISEVGLYRGAGQTVEKQKTRQPGRIVALNEVTLVAEST
jgi:hypothetical protein